MSNYIAFELDALNRVPHVADACSVPAERISHGLLGLWAYCFREETDRVTAVHLRGFFGGADPGDALEAFGFLERDGKQWRVRGADRYLRVTAGRRKGGLAAAKNLIPGAYQKMKAAEAQAKDSALAEPSSSPDASSAGPGAFTDERAPNTEHRTPKKISAGPQKPRKPSLAEEVYEEIQLTRAERMRELGMQPQPDEHHGPGFINTALKRIADQAGTKVTIAAQLFDLFLQKPWAAEKAPPFPFGAFVSEKVWPKLLAEMNAEGEAA